MTAAAESEYYSAAAESQRVAAALARLEDLKPGPSFVEYDTASGVVRELSYEAWTFGNVASFLHPRCGPADLDLADLYRKVVHAAMTRLPAVFAAPIFFDFCVRWLEVSQERGDCRRLVETIVQALRPLYDDDAGEVDEGARVRAVAAAVVGFKYGLCPSSPLVVEHPWRGRRPVVIPGRGAQLRAPRRWRQRQRQRRRRVRSGSRGDPPRPEDGPEPPSDLTWCAR